MKRRHDVTEQILMRSVMKITEGRLDQFCDAIFEALESAEKHGPQLMVQTFTDREGMRATSFQLYRNSADVLRHWELSGSCIKKVSLHCTVEQFELYGNPSEEVAAGISQFIGDGRGRIVKPLMGFSRF